MYAFAGCSLFAFICSYKDSAFTQSQNEYLSVQMKILRTGHFPVRSVYYTESEFHGIGCEVFLYHKRDLEDYRMVKLSQVESCQLLYLVKSVYKRISVYEELS